MRTMLLLTGLLTTGCVSFVPLDRGDWRRVYTEDATALRGPEAKQEFITAEKFEDEQTAGIQRSYEYPSGFTVPLLNDAERIELKVGEVQEFLVDERSGTAELSVKGNVAEWFWNPMVKKDEWVNDEGVTRRRSSLFVRGRKPGQAVLRLIVGNDQQDFVVTVR
ncbi:MAG: hypothetical protein JNG84_02490 [Archangium sp.]|nr:hypothetical protein [Archangium sp.]